jgi:hypothetical protein
MFEKLTEKDEFVLSVFPDGTGFGNFETTSLTGPDYQHFTPEAGVSHFGLLGP